MALLERASLAACAAPLLLSLIMFGCGSSPARQSSPAGEQPAARVPAVELESPAAGGPLSGISDFQRALLADGVLTLAEYEQAILAFRECAVGLGYQLREWMPRHDRGYSVSATYRLPEGQKESLETAQSRTAQLQRCHREYLEAVGYVWIKEHHPSESEFQQAREALGACLREQGEEFPANPTEGDFTRYHRTPLAARANIDAFPICQERIADEFDLPGFGG
jgi:hypothetical protein